MSGLITEKPKLLDLFCGVGGAAVGYYRSGFEIIGVDIKKQPNYPFKFHLGEALEYLAANGKDFDAVHASPPCQGYSKHVSSDGRWSHGVHDGFNTPKLIEPLRKLFNELNIPWVIENVPGARHEMINPILLCGAMFNLKIKRHRLFESNISIHAPEVHPKCTGLTHPIAEEFRQRVGASDRRIYTVVGKGRQSGTVKVWQALMDIPWAKRDVELAEAIPPSFTEFIGKQIVGVER